jgi:hypothetical protein
VGFRACWQQAGAICFTLLKVLVGIPQNSQLIGTQKFRSKRKKEKSPPNGACPAMPPMTVSLPFLSVPVPVLCGPAVRAPASQNWNRPLMLGIDPQPEEVFLPQPEGGVTL